MNTVNKHNVCTIIETYLKEQKLPFNVLHSNNTVVNYEIFSGSTECYIQVEYKLDDTTDNEVFLQLFTKQNELAESHYHQEWMSWETEFQDSIESEIESLIEATKKLNKAFAKISAKLEQIKELCAENNLDFEELITVNFDMD
jgi:hypothetical protein